MADDWRSSKKERKGGLGAIIPTREDLYTKEKFDRHSDGDFEKHLFDQHQPDKSFRYWTLN